MKKILSIVFFVFTYFTINAQVSISTDFTDMNKGEEELYDIWSVANRIAPENGVTVRPGVRVNTVRMLGGISKIVNGNRVPNYEYDPCRYDSINNTYVYNWTKFISRIDAIRNSSTELFQIVIDQPCWAFQHGYNFIPDGQAYNGKDFKESERITIYGNSLPPKDKIAYSDFIKAMMQELVSNYGETELLSWRFRVGSEIETPDHWRGTKQDFIDFYANTEQAVRSVLPNAKIGVHTREPSFLYRNGNETNYKGEPFASFAADLIDYCFDNNIKYDFWGITDYILVNDARSLKLEQKYDQLFAALIENPKWNSNARLDIMEYAPITAIGGASFLRASTTHAEMIDLAFSHMFYKNHDKGLDFVYRWGVRSGANEGVIKVVNTMLNKQRFETTISGAPSITSNRLDAIFAKSNTDNEFDVLLYNYNDASLAYRNSESVALSFNVDLPIGTSIYYRSALYGEDQNAFQTFLNQNPPASQWIKSGSNRRGLPDDVLNASGLTAFGNFEHQTPYTFGNWININTIPRTDGGSGSLVALDAEIPSFAYMKFEFQAIPDFVQDIAPTKVIWTTTEDFQPWKPASPGMSIDTDNDELTLNFLESPWGFPMAEIDNLNINSDNYDTFRIVIKNTTDTATIQMVANVPGQDFSSSRKIINVPPNQDFITIDIDISDWALWEGIINQFKLYARTKTGSLVIDSMEFIPRADATVLNMGLSQEGNGLLNYRSGTCFSGRELKLVAIPDEGWEFQGWTGDITSSDNPLEITINADTNIKAIFSNTLSINDPLFKERLRIYPNPSNSGLFNLSHNQKWEVYALSGVQVAKGEGEKINLSQFAQGLYLLKTEIGSFKLVKN